MAGPGLATIVIQLLVTPSWRKSHLPANKLHLYVVSGPFMKPWSVKETRPYIRQRQEPDHDEDTSYTQISAQELKIYYTVLPMT